MSERRIPIMLLPPVPVVPRRDFTDLKIDAEMRDRMWDIIGPTVHFNLSKGIDSLRDAFIAVYYQGIENGVSAMRARAETEVSP